MWHPYIWSPDKCSLIVSTCTLGKIIVSIDAKLQSGSHTTRWQHQTHWNRLCACKMGYRSTFRPCTLSWIAPHIIFSTKISFYYWYGILNLAWVLLRWWAYVILFYYHTSLQMDMYAVSCMVDPLLHWNTYIWIVTTY